MITTTRISLQRYPVMAVRWNTPIHPSRTTKGEKKGDSWIHPSRTGGVQQHPSRNTKWEKRGNTPIHPSRTTKGEKEGDSWIHPSRTGSFQQQVVETYGDGESDVYEKNDASARFAAGAFRKHLKLRLDKGAVNRTMSILKKATDPPTLNSWEELEATPMLVDSVIGILSKKKEIKEKCPKSQSEPHVQSQREKTENTKRKDTRLAEESYFSDGVAPFQCPYTKELETLHHQAEDRLLKFPIDNEDIVWEESTVPFTDHIFLHKYISLFPPATHRFMETIITALQNNPDLTVNKKREIIWSYLNYFTYFSELLDEDEEEVLTI